MKKVEILSPVGGMHVLNAAIEGGADAVYLGGKQFGARNYADNFDLEEMKSVILKCHLYGIKVYVTLNTSIYEREVSSFMEYVDFLCSNGVDALIMQDLGMIDLVHKTYPSLELHGSTQMHIHTLEGALFAKRIGLKRIVLARETPISVICEIKKKVDIEIEVFVHGALCMSYSGQCLMSYLTHGRSGNRGTCSQCCRLPYQVDGDSLYILSMKDLCTLEHLDKLVALGIDSFKIEGRMKSPEYVYLTTFLYQKYTKQYQETGMLFVDKQDLIDLQKIFSRSFTPGYMFEKNYENITNDYRGNHMGIPIGKVVNVKNRIFIKLSASVRQGDAIRILHSKRDVGGYLNYIYKKENLVKEAKAGDVISIPYMAGVSVLDEVLKTVDISLQKHLQKRIENRKRKVVLKGTLCIQIGAPISFTLFDGNSKVQVQSSYLVQKASNAPLTKQRIEMQMKKLGDSVFSLEELDINMEESIFIPIHVLNELRREATLKLEEKRCEGKVYEKKNYFLEVPFFPQEKTKSIVLLDDSFFDEVLKENFSNIYFEEYDQYQKWQQYSNVGFRLPRIEPPFYAASSFLVGEVGSILRGKCSTDYSFNVFNSYTVALLHSMGVGKVTLSIELSEEDIKELIEKYRLRYHKNPSLSFFLYGRVEAMVMKMDFLKKYQKDSIEITDSYNHSFLLKKKDYYTVLYDKTVRNLKASSYYALGILDVCFFVSNKNEWDFLKKNLKFIGE